MNGLFSTRRDRPRRVRGQSLVEFSLVLPIFLLVFFGVIDGGRAVYMHTVLSDASREGARVAAVEAAWIGSTDPACNKYGGPVCPSSVAALKADVVAAVNRRVVPFGPIAAARVYVSCHAQGSAPTGSWTTQSCNSSAPNNAVSVRVELQYTALTPVIGQMLPPFWMSGSTTMIIN